MELALSGYAFRVGRKAMAESCLHSCVVTERRPGALTVAGQWRIFTAFPNILAIAVLTCSFWGEQDLKCHGNDFHDMNIYSWGREGTSKRLFRASSAVLRSPAEPHFG